MAIGHYGGEGSLAHTTSGDTNNTHMRQQNDTTNEQ